VVRAATRDATLSVSALHKPNRGGVQGMVRSRQTDRGKDAPRSYRRRTREARADGAEGSRSGSFAEHRSATMSAIAAAAHRKMGVARSSQRKCRRNDRKAERGEQKDG